MASPARPSSVSGPFGSVPDLAIFSTLTTTERLNPTGAGETAAGFTMAKTCSGPRQPNLLHAGHSPTSKSSPAPYVPTSEGDVLTRIRILLPKGGGGSLRPCLLSPSVWAGGCLLFPA
ncbi:hypothetical protein VPH35_129991 [Triticum aestivum]